MIRTRFAPSPTGFLHVGSLYTALFDYLFAKANGGQFLVRIEDTDRERFVEGGVENMVRSLKWAGLVIDEGVDMDESGNVIQKGQSGPYIQSERLDIYQEHVQNLLDAGHAYYCFCSKERLDEVRATQEAQKKPTIYDGFCRNLPEEEVRIMLQEDQERVVRMKMPQTGVTKVNDLIHGEVEFRNDLIDDQVLLKSDGFPTYHLANVVDDHLMNITHVIRGEEWLPSVPKHVVLYQMFGWEMPQFAHIPLLVNEKKQKLSKRHGDVSVEDFKAKGYLPEAMVNFIAFLGWNPGDDREIFSLAELEKVFSLDRVGKSAAIFNLEKLAWYNREYLKKMSLKDLATICRPFFVNAGHEIDTASIDLEAVVALEKERASTLVELVDEVSFVFAEKLNYEAELLVWKKSTREDAKDKLIAVAEFLQAVDETNWQKDVLEVQMMAWISNQGWGNGDVLWPLRVALSGKKNSPGPFEIAAVLGKNKTLERIRQAIERL